MRDPHHLQALAAWPHMPPADRRRALTKAMQNGWPLPTILATIDRTPTQLAEDTR